MNRRELFSILAGTAVGLLVPTRTIFLPPRGGWFVPTKQAWAVKMEGGYFYSESLLALLNNPEFDSYPITNVPTNTEWLSPMFKDLDNRRIHLLPPIVT